MKLAIQAQPSRPFLSSTITRTTLQLSLYNDQQMLLLAKWQWQPLHTSKELETPRDRGTLTSTRRSDKSWASLAQDPQRSAGDKHRWKRVGKSLSGLFDQYFRQAL
ncbi:hypothetical protein SCHPADRAFT_125000 [Schizopora paradoxa]|uniref:Uncharacterized protein n=1 Tax=Schizopora paradoxa TaxID=27342 RepID=A0A0H2S2F3_9AGAM|nr:hypothetical protein SCHPADRAFT_125000 [Schizopora paradoxa]